MNRYDVIVIGAGAAGLFCARTAGLRGRRVLVLDHAEKLGLKILISGGGRCNFTNLNTTSDDFVSANAHFCKSALAQFSPQDFLQLVQKYRIDYHHKTPGQLFCDRSSREILQLLLEECRSARVEMQFPVKIETVAFSQGEFQVATSQGGFFAKSLVVATGGISYKKLGASPFGYELAKKFGHQITPLQPALVGFSCDADLKEVCQKLSGMTLPVEAKIAKRKFREGLVFTHFGLSGPALLNLSLYWQKGQVLSLIWRPEINLSQELTALRTHHPKLHFKNACKQFFPDRFVEAFVEFLKITDGPLEKMSLPQLKGSAERLQTLSFIPNDTAGFDRAEVTRGGVSTEDISSQTLESKLQPGLFFAGEVLDVTGRLGGFNFQWAFSSGFVAGSHCG